MSSKAGSPDENIHRRTLERMSDAVVSVNTDFQYTYLNQKAEELLGKTQSELLGDAIWTAFPEAENTIAQEQIEKALHTNQQTQYERYNESVDSWLEVRVFPDEDGLSIFFTDIAERKEREIELERYERIIETLPVAVGQNTPGTEGEFEYVNQGMVKMFDLESKEEAKQYAPADLYANPQQREVLNQRLQEQGEVHDFEVELEKPAGEQFWGSASAFLDTIGGEEYVIGVIQDISERKEREEQLLIKEQLLNTLFEYSPIHLFVKDRKCRHSWISSTLVEDPGRYLGKHEIEVDADASEEYCVQTLREDRRVINTEEHIIANEEYNETLDKWLLTSKVPWYDEDGSVAGLLGYSVDITDRKEYQKQLEQQNERLDEFASLISHDLRNSLTVALGRTTILQQMCSGDQKASEQLDVVAKSLDRMEQIVEDTLTLARKGDTVGDLVPISLLELCGNCWQGINTAEATLDFRNDMSIRGDADRLKHVFENLFRNAIEHGGTDVTITIGRSGETEFYVEDNGSGIPEGSQNSIFEAGNSSEPDGTGLGLAIVKRIAEAHGWEVSVTGGSNGGARFEFDNVDFADTSLSYNSSRQI